MLGSRIHPDCTNLFEVLVLSREICNDIRHYRYCKIAESHCSNNQLHKASASYLVLDTRTLVGMLYTMMLQPC